MERRRCVKEKRRSVKQRIRDTKRLLSKEDLPETVRLTKERLLRCLATELEEKQQEARDKKLSKKYRMVKFFDKRKVLRKLKIQQKEWSSCADVPKRGELLLSLEKLRKELNYVVHFPPSEKYLALYPTSDSTDMKALAKKDQMLQQIAEMVNSGELSDASSPHLPPALLLQFSCSTVDSTHTYRALPGLSNRELKPESTNGCFLPVDSQMRAGKGKKRVYTAAVDEEPEVDAKVAMVKSKRRLAAEDDFFLLDSAI